VACRLFVCTGRHALSDLDHGDGLRGVCGVVIAASTSYYLLTFGVYDTSIVGGGRGHKVWNVFEMRWFLISARMKSSV